MADGSPIEWLQKPGYKGATWNPTRGCARQGDGCLHCWAISMARRQDVPGGAYEGLTTIRNGRVDWLGIARPAPDMLALPLRWRSPRCVFVESMGDLFHPGIPFEYIAACFGVMAATPQHLHIILTKQPKRARAFFDWVTSTATDEGSGRFCTPAEACRGAALDRIPHRNPDGSWPDDYTRPLGGYDQRWPLPNVWLLVSAWDDASARKYVPEILECPAVVHGVSAEPLLGPMDLSEWMHDSTCNDVGHRSIRGCICSEPREVHLDWVIVGGESGARARPMHEEWALSLRQQCAAAKGVAFHFKQWGNHAPNASGELVKLRSKKEGGRILSGRTWDEFPECE